VVLGMIPLARELLRMGSEVVMVANSLPAINDVTCAELRTLLASVCDICPILKVCLLNHKGHNCLNTVCRISAHQMWFICMLSQQTTKEGSGYSAKAGRQAYKS